MEEVETKDIKKGEVYYAECYHKWIRRAYEDGSSYSHSKICMDDKSYQSISGSLSTAQHYKATPQQIAWLEACEKAGKYVPEPKEQRIEKFVEGQYYTWNSNGNWIFKATSSSKSTSYCPQIDKEESSFSHGGFYIEWTETNKEYKLATSEEIQWLDACIEADKFVPKENLNKSSFEVEDLIEGECYYHELDNNWVFQYKNYDATQDWVQGYVGIRLDSSFTDTPYLNPVGENLRLATPSEKARLQGLNGYKNLSNKELTKHDMVPGKCYYMETGYNWVLQFKELNGNWIKSTCHYAVHTLSLNSSGGWDSNPTYIREATPEEIEKLQQSEYYLHTNTTIQKPEPVWEPVKIHSATEVVQEDYVPFTRKKKKKRIELTFKSL